MRMHVTVPPIAAIALTGALIAAAQLPASAAPVSPVSGPAAGPAVSIGARSGIPELGKDVYVLYNSIAKYSDARISGAITGAATGQVAELFARQFPYKSGWAEVGSPDTLTVTGASVKYAFTASPGLATEYKVELLATPSSTSPLATSRAVTVYVVGSGRVLSQHGCVRPVCHIKITIEAFTPPAALRTEIKKHWYTYFAINFSRHRPRWLYRGAGDGRASASRKVAANAYKITFTFTFRVGDRGYYYELNFCAKDTESKDGLGLPGHHSCGDRRITGGKIQYLG